MLKLIQGIHEFQSNVFEGRRELFERLASGQSPDTLFITCSDSRVDPNLITQAHPGELFMIRNAGNIVPTHGPHAGGEAATIEYAVATLKVKDIVICGHTDCGAMKAVLNEASLADLPRVAAWLEHAEAARQIVRTHYKHLAEDDQLTAAVQENVLVQMEHLRTQPSVANALAGGDLRLHGWVYKIETGEIFAFDSTEREFVPVSLSHAAPPDPVVPRQVI